MTLLHAHRLSRTVHIPTLLHPFLTPRRLPDHSAASAHAPWPSWSPVAPSQAIARIPRLSQASPHPLSPSGGPPTYIDLPGLTACSAHTPSASAAPQGLSPLPWVPHTALQHRWPCPRLIQACTCLPS